jgi:hypothetical protein
MVQVLLLLLLQVEVVFLICKYLLLQAHGLIQAALEKVKVTVVGGGGNGGSANSAGTYWNGGGGAGGGTAIEVIPFPSQELMFL